MDTNLFRIMAAFVLHGTSVGGLFVRLPQIQAALGISEGVYGLVLLAMPAGVLLGSLTVPTPIERFGTRPTIAASLVVSVALQMATALAPGAAALAASLFAYGLAFSGANVAINVEANRYEAAHAARVISRCHGWWAMGFLATSLVSAGLIRAGVTPLGQFAGQTFLTAALVALLVLPMVEVPPREPAQRSRRFAVPGRGVLLIGAWALAAILMEGTTRGWIVIYLRDTFGAAESVAALALSAIVLTQTAGRFAGDRLISRHGLVRVARASSVVLAVGILGIVLAPGVPMALAGCLLIGLGIAVAVPQAFAAAARLPGPPPAESVAAFASLSTLIGFLGPPLFGALAESTGLRTAFALVMPLTVVSLAMARLLQPRAA